VDYRVVLRRPGAIAAAEYPNELVGDLYFVTKPAWAAVNGELGWTDSKFNDFGRTVSNQ